MSQWQPHIRNSRHHKDNLKDCERYKQHIADIERAIEIIEGDEPALIKKIMLEEMGLDSVTYGDVLYNGGQVRSVNLDTKQKHIWGLYSEMKSFKHAIKLIEEYD